MAKSDYSKDLFKQVQELMLKCDNLSSEVKTIEKRTEKKFKKQIKEMKQQYEEKIDQLENRVSYLEKENQKLKDDNDRLKKQINNDRKTDKLTLAGLLMLGKVQDIIQVRPNYFLDYREIEDATTTERWSHRITSSADEEWAGNLWGFFNKIVNRLTADIEVPFALDKNMMRINDTDVHKSVRERTCK